MKAMVTGMSGTVGPALAEALSETGHTVVRWDRERIPVDDPPAIRAFLRAENPDWFFHLATGPGEWAALVAGLTAELDIRFLFTSSVSVYGPTQQGPFSVAHAPEPRDAYGGYKLDCERRVSAGHPEALIVRLGWQIGTGRGGNHMVDFLHRTFETEGRVETGTRWYPACSFLSDTGFALSRAMQSLAPGLYHLDGNPGLSFHEIATGLERLEGTSWNLQPVAEPVRNHRLADPRIRVRSISRWFE